MSEEYNLIQLGSLYLTDTGLVGGAPCLTTVSGLDFSALDKDGQITVAADGTPYAFIGDGAGLGSQIRIQPSVVPEDLFNDLKTLFNTAIAAQATIAAIFTGRTGTFDLNCLPGFPRPIEFSGEFFNDNLYGVVINLVVQSFN